MKQIKVTNGKQTVVIPAVSLQTFLNSGYKEVEAKKTKSIKSEVKKEVKTDGII